MNYSARESGGLDRIRQVQPGPPEIMLSRMTAEQKSVLANTTRGSAAAAAVGLGRSDPSTIEEPDLVEAFILANMAGDRRLPEALPDDAEHRPAGSKAHPRQCQGSWCRIGEVDVPGS